MRVDDGARGRENLNGTHKSCGGDGAGGQQAAKDVEDRRPGDGVDGVDAAGNLRVCAGEVNDSAASLGIVLDVDANGDGTGEDAVVIEKVFGVPSSGGK